LIVTNQVPIISYNLW